MEPNRNWENLPLEIVVTILNSMSPVDQWSMAHTCKKWSRAFVFSQLWNSVTFPFDNVALKDHKIPDIMEVGVQVNITEQSMLVDSEYTEQTIRCWNDLPPEITVKIFLNLTPSNRYAASRTCKQWDLVFRCPVLWHSFACVFSEDTPSVLASKTMATTFWSYGENNHRIAKHCGSDLRYLWIYADHDQSAKVKRTMTDFFDSLSSSDVQLQELRLTKFTKWELQKEMSDELVVTFAKFLRTQQHLSTLYIHWPMPVFYGVIMLESLSTNCIHKLKDLCLHGLTCNIASVNSNRPYYTYITIWTQLERLVLNYESINDEILGSICTSCMSTLKELSIYFHDFSTRDKPIHKIEKNVWRKIKKTIPELKVRFRLDKTANFDSIEQVLSPEMPLAHLNIKKIFTDVCFRYFKTHFAATLETFKCKNHTEDMIMTEDMIGLVTELVTSASRLNYLTITAKIPNDIIENLCTLQNREEHGFDLHICYWKPTETEKSSLRQLQSRINSNRRRQTFFLSFVGN